MFSHDYKVMWGRGLRNDGRAFGSGAEAVFYPKGDSESALTQRVEVQGTSTALTAMVVQKEKARSFCLEASLTLDGGRVDLGDPVCHSDRAVVTWDWRIITDEKRNAI